MTPTPSSIQKASVGAAAARLRTTFAFLLYVVILFCAWRLYRLGQWLNRCSEASTVRALGADGKRASEIRGGGTHSRPAGYQDACVRVPTTISTSAAGARGCVSNEGDDAGESEGVDGVGEEARDANGNAHTSTHGQPPRLTNVDTFATVPDAQVPSRGVGGRRRYGAASAATNNITTTYTVTRLAKDTATIEAGENASGNIFPLSTRRPIIGVRWRFMHWWRRLASRWCDGSSAPSPTATASTGADASSIPPSLTSPAARKTTRSRFRCALPAIPPVLFLLLTGVAVREALEWMRFRQSLRPRKWRAAAAATMNGTAATVGVAEDKPLTLFQMLEGGMDVNAGGHDLITSLLSVSAPFLLYGLGTIGLDIGSHLTFPQLRLVKRQLCLFSLCLFPIVFAGMMLAFRYGGARLMRTEDRQEWLRHTLSAVFTPDAMNPTYNSIGSSIHDTNSRRAPTETLRRATSSYAVLARPGAPLAAIEAAGAGEATVSVVARGFRAYYSNRAGASLLAVTNAEPGANTADDVSTRATSYSTTTAVVVTRPASGAAIVDQLVEVFAAHERTALWCFAAVMACVTVERSSPEFLNAIRSTGARGILPTFVLCVTACQDILALVLFVLVSSLVRPLEVSGATRLVESIVDALMWQFAGRVEEATSADRGVGGIGDRPNRRVSVPSAVKGAFKATLPSMPGKTETNAGKELVLIAAATTGAAVTSVFLRRVWLTWMHSLDARAERRRRHARHSEFPSENTAAPSMTGASEGAHTMTTTSAVAVAPAWNANTTDGRPPPSRFACFGLLAVITTCLALWTSLTPCELLLAAVVTGSAANFFTPCPLLRFSVDALNEATNVLLFTTMGLRTHFSSYTLPATESATTSNGAESDEAVSEKLRGSASSLHLPPTTSLLLVAQWGVLLCIARVTLLWVGGFVGATIARLERMTNQYTLIPSTAVTPRNTSLAEGDQQLGGSGDGERGVATLAATKNTVSMSGNASGGGRDQTMRVRDLTTMSDTQQIVTARSRIPRPPYPSPNGATAATSVTESRPIAGIRTWIGFALITQLAIALTLNARGGEEYRSRMEGVVSCKLFTSLDNNAVIAGDRGLNATQLRALLASLAPVHVVPRMAPLVQAYTVSIAFAMISGPILGAWVLRKAASQHLA